jgi:hypothetical protein
MRTNPASTRGAGFLPAIAEHAQCFLGSGRRATLALVALATFCALATGCGGNSSNASATQPTSMSAAEAESRLKQIVLQPADAGADFTQDQAAAETNDDLARARPDTESARAQYAGWGQTLQYNVQHSTPITPDLVFSGKIARVMNTATLFQSPEGATSALAFIRDLAAPTVANFLVNDAVGTKISDTQVVKDIAFPAKGDESFGWRLTGKATFADGFTVTFVAETVFVRSGRVNGNVTAVAFGQAPKRDDVIALVDTFVERAKANG